MVQFTNAQLEVVHPIARANIPPTHTLLGLQTPCGSDCDECLVLAGASLGRASPRMLVRAAAS
eukprot:8912230-Pyramimonas_sp.AAC.1